MNKIKFNIISGVAPYLVKLEGSNKPEEYVYTLGEHEITEVPNGLYTLKITDGSGCVYEKELIVNPSVTTTTTTVLPGDTIVVGHTQDDITVFNTTATNRNGEYVGYPNPNVITLYLWVKTLDGRPLTGVKTFNYDIGVYNTTGDSSFQFVSLSDAINAEHQTTTYGATTPISGNIILNPNFIETYIEYVYYKGTEDPRFVINLQSSTPLFATNISTKDDDGNTYGIVNLNQLQVVLNY